MPKEFSSFRSYLPPKMSRKDPLCVHSHLSNLVSPIPLSLPVHMVHIKSNPIHSAPMAIVYTKILTFSHLCWSNNRIAYLTYCFPVIILYCCQSVLNSRGCDPWLKRLQDTLHSFFILYLSTLTHLPYTPNTCPLTPFFLALYLSSSKMWFKHHPTSSPGNLPSPHAQTESDTPFHCALRSYVQTPSNSCPL